MLSGHGENEHGYLLSSAVWIVTLTAAFNNNEKAEKWPKCWYYICI